jgi:hypothetical protein
MFDAEGNIHSLQPQRRGAVRLRRRTLSQQNPVTLFAPESQQVVHDYLESIKSQDIASLLDHGREVLGARARAASFRSR